ncbi:hypothetical protein LINPERPRIM_LOCUS2320 [Linum perenne]
MSRKLPQLWAKKGNIQVSDVGFGFYIVRVLKFQRIDRKLRKTLARGCKLKKNRRKARGPSPQQPKLATPATPSPPSGSSQPEHIAKKGNRFSVFANKETQEDSLPESVIAAQAAGKSVEDTLPLVVSDLVTVEAIDQTSGKENVDPSPIGPSLVPGSLFNSVPTELGLGPGSDPSPLVPPSQGPSGSAGSVAQGLFFKLPKPCESTPVASCVSDKAAVWSLEGESKGDSHLPPSQKRNHIPSKGSKISKNKAKDAGSQGVKLKTAAQKVNSKIGDSIMEEL